MARGGDDESSRFTVRVNSGNIAFPTTLNNRLHPGVFIDGNVQSPERSAIIGSAANEAVVPDAVAARQVSPRHFRHTIGIGGNLAAPPLLHHCAYGSVHGGSTDLSCGTGRERTAAIIGDVDARSQRPLMKASNCCFSLSVRYFSARRRHRRARSTVNPESHRVFPGAPPNFPGRLKLGLEALDPRLAHHHARAPADTATTRLKAAAASHRRRSRSRSLTRCLSIGMVERRNSPTSGASAWSVAIYSATHAANGARPSSELVSVTGAARAARRRRSRTPTTAGRW